MRGWGRARACGLIWGLGFYSQWNESFRRIRSRGVTGDTLPTIRQTLTPGLVLIYHYSAWYPFTVAHLLDKCLSLESNFMNSWGSLPQSPDNIVISVSNGCSPQNSQITPWVFFSDVLAFPAQICPDFLRPRETALLAFPGNFLIAFTVDLWLMAQAFNRYLDFLPLWASHFRFCLCDIASPFLWIFLEF